MKRGNLAYQYQGHSHTAKQLYAKVQRRLRTKNRRARYKTASITAFLNLATDDSQPVHWLRSVWYSALPFGRAPPIP